MFGRLMPTEGKFFDLFNQHAALCVKGAHEMVGLMTNFDDLENRTHAVESIEKQADKITYAPSTCCTRPSSPRSTATTSTS
jgi:uncharacterized protein Yka (UPF0111/DUF47 family)